MLTKTGNFFPSAEQYAKRMACALDSELGATHQAAKTLMRWTNASERTVKNWMAGTSGPRGEHLIALVRHSDAALKAFLLMADRPQALLVADLCVLRSRLLTMVQDVDGVLLIDSPTPL